MKKLLVFLLAIPFLSFGQDENGWSRQGSAGLQFTQVTLVNWNAGGQNSLAGVSSFNYSVNYQDSTSAWTNALELAYGLQKQGEGAVIKIDDKIDFASQYNHDFYNDWKYAGLLNFRTQFTDGFNYPNDSVKISTALAPAYLIASAGFEYKPNKNFGLMISPLTGKLTLVTDTFLSNQGAFGVEAGETSRMELGAFIKARYKVSLMENVSLEARADLFSNYLNNPENIDINAEARVNMKVNDFITVTLHAHTIYDDDIMIAYDDADPSKTGPRLQYKQVVGLGLLYKF